MQVLCWGARFATCRCLPRHLSCCGTAARPPSYHAWLVLRRVAILIAGFTGGVCFVRPRRLLLLSFLCAGFVCQAVGSFSPCVRASGLPDFGPCVPPVHLSPFPTGVLWLSLPYPPLCGCVRLASSTFPHPGPIRFSPNTLYGEASSFLVGFPAVGCWQVPLAGVSTSL